MATLLSQSTGRQSSEAPYIEVETAKRAEIELNIDDAINQFYTKSALSTASYQIFQKILEYRKGTGRN